MHRPSSESEAARRARWIADLLTAIDEAQAVAWRLSRENPGSGALELYGRLEKARAEVEALRRSGWANQRQSLPPEWIEFLPEGLRPLRAG